MKLLPAQFSEYFCEVSSVYERSTRASTQNNYFMPFVKRTKLQNSIRYQLPLIWNSSDSSSSSSSFNSVFPRCRRWPNTPHPLLDCSYSIPPSRSICIILNLQPDFLYTLFHLPPPCHFWPSSPRLKN